MSDSVASRQTKQPPVWVPTYLASTIEASHLPTWIPLMASNVVQVVAAVAGLAEANIRPAGTASVRRGTNSWEHRQCRFNSPSIDSPRSGDYIPCRK